MKEPLKSYIQLHSAVILFGFTAILGDLIALPPYMIVWWRVFLTSVSFLFLIKSISRIRQLPRRYLAAYVLIGILAALHWIFFFGAIKFSNASITLVALATTTFFTSVMEPIILRRKFEWLELLLGIIIIPGMILIVNNIAVEMRIGILFGLISAFLGASFTSLNKKYIVAGMEQGISFLELFSAWVFLTIGFPLFNFMDPIHDFLPKGVDWIYLIILSVICTTFAYVLALKALNHLSAFVSSLTINLEPIYGILLAIVLLNEHKDLNVNFYVGVTLIVGSAMIYPLIMRRRRMPLKL